MPTDSYTDSSSVGSSIADDAPSGSHFASFRALSDHDRAAITAIIETKVRIKLAQGQAREDVKAVADKLGMKPAELNKIVRLAMLERDKGNVLVHEKALIELAEQLVP
jgi:hypothetical protein